MGPVTAMKVLADMPDISRELVRTELVAMAKKVEGLIETREKERAFTERQVSFFACFETRPLMTIIYQFEVLRLDRVIRRLQHTLGVILEVSDETSQADYKHLLAEVTYLKDDTLCLLGFNAGCLPRDARQHLHTADKLLRAELSPN